MNHLPESCGHLGMIRLTLIPGTVTSLLISPEVVTQIYVSWLQPTRLMAQLSSRLEKLSRAQRHRWRTSMELLEETEGYLWRPIHWCFSWDNLGLRDAYSSNGSKWLISCNDCKASHLGILHSFRHRHTDLFLVAQLVCKHASLTLQCFWVMSKLAHARFSFNEVCNTTCGLTVFAFLFFKWRHHSSPYLISLSLSLSLSRQASPILWLDFPTEFLLPFSAPFCNASKIRLTINMDWCDWNSIKLQS